ncbi:MAG TPA: PilZ domain-containing protein [Tepidisphaeraceae bacterium]|jgi:hypothetical protein|nr:PilZ domain-containing protein [Tepidisphaeraceae bacterium]
MSDNTNKSGMYEVDAVGDERRRMPRAKYEVAATLVGTGVDGQEFTLYTRDVNAGGSGFVSPTDLQDIEAATIRIPAPDGGVRHVRCHVRRTREIGEGWVEGYVEFEEPTSVFSTKRINAAHATQPKGPVFAGI